MREEDLGGAPLEEAEGHGRVAGEAPLHDDEGAGEERADDEEGDDEGRGPVVGRAAAGDGDLGWAMLACVLGLGGRKDTYQKEYDAC